MTEALLFEGETFTLELPLSWDGKYSLEVGPDYYAFYNIENNMAGYGGKLFNIEMFGSVDAWKQLPAAQYLDEKDGVYYAASFPTDFMPKLRCIFCKT